MINRSVKEESLQANILTIQGVVVISIAEGSGAGGRVLQCLFRGGMG